MDNTNKAKGNDGFSSKLGFILAAAGSAVGLGNLWRFPYMAGMNGGGSFVLLYLLCVILIGLSLLAVEIIIGRNGKASAIECYGKHNKGFKIAGYLGTIAIMLLLSFYAIIGGWTIAYIFKALSGNLIGLSPDELGSVMGALFSSPGQLVVYQILFLAATAYIVAKGIAGGIEKYCKVLMPALFVMLIVLAIRSVTLPGAWEGLVWLFKPDFTKITGATVVSALGQAFFSLSIGSCGMVTYAAYLNKKENIPQISLSVAVADTAVGLLAGIVILPAVFAFGLEPGAGAGLVFITLPQVFSSMPFGTILAVAFFILLFVAAITSSINMLEVWVTIAVEKTKMNRVKSTIACTLLAFVIGIPPLLSFGPWSNILVFGKNFMDLYDYTSSSVLFPVVGILGAILVGYVWDKKAVLNEITNEGELPFKMFNIWYASVRYVIPVVLTLIFLQAVGILKF